MPVGLTGKSRLCYTRVTMALPLESSGDDGDLSRRVRTRFAPSPTGFLHVGALRTALFSWLLARHAGGDFLLRIEDTDRNRLVPGALEQIIASLRAMGMDYDEGPDRASAAALDVEKYGTVRPDLLPENGGAQGPYFQSQRLGRYREVVNRLVAENRAYYAFETPEELAALRAQSEARKQPFLYRGETYRDYPAEASRARAERGEPHVVRFKMPQMGTIRTEDALRGTTEWDAATQDDFVILKSDGFPPYHLAAIVDDHDMGISHAVRSTEWLSSSPKHFCLYEALGWEPPIYVHVASVNGSDGKKLSKRTGAKPVVGQIIDPKTGDVTTSFLDDGYLVEALFNFLALTGWSPGDDTEIMDRDEILRRFRLEGLAVSPAVFDLDKLTWMNGVYIRSLPPDDLLCRVLPFLSRAGLIPADPDETTRAYIRQVLLLEQERLKRLDEAPGLVDFFFGDLPDYQQRSVERWLRREADATGAYLRELQTELAEQRAWTAEALEATVRGVGARHGRERGDLTHPVRVAVTGREVGPGLFETLAVLGKERVLRRLEKATELAYA